MVVGVEKRGWTFHDFPHADGKCPHFWIVNVTPPGRPHCIHNCPFCYARWAVYSDRSWDGPFRFYKNITEVVKKELAEYDIAPPIYLSSVTDVCQKVPELLEVVGDLVNLIIDRGVSFMVTTKGDPRFIVDAVHRKGFARFILQVSVEGPPEVLRYTSPGALSYEDRLSVVRYARARNVPVFIRLDPFFYHIYLGLFGSGWREVLLGMFYDFKGCGVCGVIGSTGRFSGKYFVDEKGNVVGCDFETYKKLCSSLGVSSRQVEREHSKEIRRGVKGIFLKKELVRLFHMVCLEISKDTSVSYFPCDMGDSCDAFSLPTCFKREDLFYPIEGCNSRCYSCEVKNPICEHLKKVKGPLKRSHLKLKLTPLERFLMGI